MIAPIVNKLLQQDFNTDAWRRLKETLAARITDLHRQLESTTLTVEKTATLRGQILECRNLLALERPPVMEPGPEIQRRHATNPLDRVAFSE